MTTNRLTRRDFVRDTAAVAAGAAFGLTPTYTVAAGNPEKADTDKILNYNPDMEYRRCGKTGWMVSAVCLGGHWKRIDTVVKGIAAGGWVGLNLNNPDFVKNRDEVVGRCIDRGINYIDACMHQEFLAFARALKGRRDKMYLGFSFAEVEVRNPEFRKADKLIESLDKGMKEAGLDYIDLWRITCLEQSSQHDEGTIEETMKALAQAKKSGRVRHTGISSHDRKHIKMLIEKYPDEMEVVCTPYTAKTKVVEDESGLWASMKKHDVGWFGIKPFASNSIFKGTSKPDDPNAEEDDKIARLALRYILCNPAITAPIPGMISVEQVDNAALAVAERRELDVEEKAQLDAAMDRAWANLPFHYQWLKDWEYV